MLDRKLYDVATPIAELETELEARARAFRDTVVPASALHMDAATGNLIVQNGCSIEHPLQDQALALLARRLRIPLEYLRRCPTELRAANVNVWLRQMRNTEVFVRFDGEAVRAILSSAYRPVDNLDVVRGLRDATRGQDPGLQVRYEWTPTRFVCQVLAERSKRSVAGEEYLGGAHVGNSEVGYAAISIEAMVLRCVCSNGMVVEDRTLRIRRVHRGGPERFQVALDGLAGNLIRIVPAMEDAVVAAMRERMVMDDEALGQALGSIEVGETTREAIRAQVLTQGVRTRMDLVNAVTSVANSPEVAFQDREALQRLGGQLLQNQLAISTLAA